MKQKPRLLYGASIRRRRYFGRFLRAAFLAAVSAAAYLALAEAARRGVVAPPIPEIGQLAALLLLVLLAVRGLVNLVLSLIRRSESVRFFDQGFVWTKRGAQHKYAWHQLASYREGARGLYLARWPLVQWGGEHVHDGRRPTFRYDGRFGDTRAGADAVRRYASYVTGVRMGRTLRADQAVRLHRHLIVYPTGIESGKEEIHWSEVDVRLEGRRLVIRRLDERGRFKTVSRYDPREVDNVGGFLELASATIRNYQPERFHRERAI